MPETKTRILPRLLIAALILAGLGFAGWFATRPKPVEVELATIARGTVEATVVNTRAGTIKACRRAKLAPAAGGQIVKLWVKEGDRVKKGQPLLELWNTDLAAQRELAQRQLALAQERRREACICTDNARRQAERTRQLADKGFRAAKPARMLMPMRAPARPVATLLPGMSNARGRKSKLHRPDWSARY